MTEHPGLSAGNYEALVSERHNDSTRVPLNDNGGQSIGLDGVEVWLAGGVRVATRYEPRPQPELFCVSATRGLAGDDLQRRRGPPLRAKDEPPQSERASAFRA